MASIDKFRDHGWKDVVPAVDQKIYEPYSRATYVGRKPALLAVDLYNLVYRGGNAAPETLVDRYPSSQGWFAHRTIAPIQRLIAAARRRHEAEFLTARRAGHEAAQPAARA
jgi:maleamate amidohydrolase